MSIYTQNGFENRKDYLRNLAEDYGVSEDKVFEVASLLGSNEDFDGLLNELEDLAGENEDMSIF